MANFPTTSITLEASGKTIATARGYTAKTLKYGKINHKITLTSLCLTGSAVERGEKFSELKDFVLVIEKPNSLIVYSGCNWTETVGDEVVLYYANASAQKRMENEYV